MISEIIKTLNSFNSIRLEEMERVKLMDRVDTKYLLPANRVPDLLGMMQGRYQVLETGINRISSYETVYLDTPDYYFFNQHVTDRPGRVKIRFRSYKLTGITFLEIKRKTKKGRTIKWRIENYFLDDKLNNNAVEFINSHLHIDNNELRPVLSNSFERITLAAFDRNERITVDLNNSFVSPEGNSYKMPLVAIVELKSEGPAVRSPFSRLIKQFSSYPTGFSKYCIGCAMLYDLPLKNILKSKILLINRIENEYNGSLSA